MENYGRLIAVHRKSAGLSQADLAKNAGLSPSTLCRIESGNRHPKADNLLRLATELSMSDSDIDQLLLSAGYAPRNKTTFEVQINSNDRGASIFE